jgi:hypothetical protein
VIDEWVEPASRAASHITIHTVAKSSRTTSTGHTKSDVPSPSLTAATGRSSGPSESLLSHATGVKIVSHRQLDSAKATVEPARDVMEVYSDGSLSDNDETKGEERLAAINSPLKGKKRVTSEVGLHFFVVVMVT